MQQGDRGWGQDAHFDVNMLDETPSKRTAESIALRLKREKYMCDMYVRLFSSRGKEGGHATLNVAVNYGRQAIFIYFCTKINLSMSL